ncbi:MAG TPA: hypothetical protein VGL86_27480 [Polyangia bacterium]
MVAVMGVAHAKPSYFEERSAAVFASFLSFTAARTVEEDQNRLQQLRDREALLLPGGAASLRAGMMGSMVMGAAVVLVAHAPRRVRAIVDGPVHVGPALFEGGGMGAGIGGRF